MLIRRLHAGRARPRRATARLREELEASSPKRIEDLAACGSPRVMASKNRAIFPLSSSLDVERVRRDFPALAQKVHGHPLVYLDNAATTQKPTLVLDRIRSSYIEECANIHRGVYQLSERATAAHEAAREKVRAFLGAEKTSEIVFVRGATEAINLVAQSYGRARHRRRRRNPHHRRWSTIRTSCRGRCCAKSAARILKVAPMDDNGDLDRRRIRKAPWPANQAGCLHLGLERPRHRQSGQGHDRGRPSRRRRGPGRRRAGRAPPRARRAGSRLRFPGFLRPQDLRPDRHRRALRQASACWKRCRPGRAAAT